MTENPRAAHKIMNNINKIIRMASVGAALAVVFTIAFATPASAHAGYSAYGNNNYGGNNYNRNYSTQPYYSYNYSNPRPIIISQPPQVVYQQPQVIYQQPQVIYQQSQPQVIYQQPQVVYQQPQVVYQQPTYYPITVSCYANPTSVSTGQSVTWQAYVSGGSNSYRLL